MPRSVRSRRRNSTIERIAAQVRAQGPVIDQARAQLASAEADSLRAASEFERATNLLRTFNATPQRVEQARADRDRTAATVVSARAAIGGATATLAVLEAQKGEAESTRAELQTALERAERDLSFTEIKAPFDGVIGNRAVQPGHYVQTGQRLASLVPLDASMSTPISRRRSLRALQPGPDGRDLRSTPCRQQIDGTVESFAPASGSVFSLLPPDNATGNFTKIVQRVPVRIRVPADIARAGMLRPGMSVVVEVDTARTQCAR